MARTLTAAVLIEVARNIKAPAVFVSMEFETGILRLWSGVGPMDWNGETWLGTGDLGAISEIEETTEMEASGIRLSLMGVKLENLALALGQVKQGLPVEVWMGFLTNDGAIVIDPASVFYGAMDVPEIVEDGETVDLSILVESRMQTISAKKDRRRTHEDQQIDYPGDLGLEFVAGLQNKEITWQ